MQKNQYNFEATGRKLFRSERVAAQVFADKYAAGTAQPTEQQAQQQMKKERDRVRRAVVSGEQVVTELYGEVQKKRRAVGVKRLAKTTSQANLKAAVKGALLTTLKSSKPRKVG